MKTIDIPENMIGVLYRMCEEEKKLQRNCINEEIEEGDNRFIEKRKYIINQCDNIIKQLDREEF